MLQLREIMTTDVLTVTPETTLREAAALLTGRHVSGAPVVEGGRVVGVVSTSDILAFDASSPETTRAAGGAPPAGWGELPGWEEAEPPAPFFREATADDAAAGLTSEAAGAAQGPLAWRTVAEVMTRRVYALRPTVDVSAAADRMRSAGIHRVLVMEGGTLLGVATTMDLARAVADHRITTRTFVFGDTTPEPEEEDGGGIASGERGEEPEGTRLEERREDA